jgi:hypothetical protein
MSQIEFSSHALLRMEERGISRQFVRQALKRPDKLDVSRRDPSRILVKKLYFNKLLEKEHLLMIIAVKEKGRLRVITIIDTSKISKYF